MGDTIQRNRYWYCFQLVEHLRRTSSGTLSDTVHSMINKLISDSLQSASIEVKVAKVDGELHSLLQWLLLERDVPLGLSFTITTVRGREAQNRMGRRRSKETSKLLKMPTKVCHEIIRGGSHYLLDGYHSPSSGSSRALRQKLSWIHVIDSLGWEIIPRW